MRSVFWKFKIVTILGYFWGTFGDFIISIITVVSVVEFGALEPRVDTVTFHLRAVNIDIFK